MRMLKTDSKCLYHGSIKSENTPIKTKCIALSSRCDVDWCLSYIANLDAMPDKATLTRIISYLCLLECHDSTYMYFQKQGWSQFFIKQHTDHDHDSKLHRKTFYISINLGFTKYLNSNDIIHPNQAGFRADFSCSDHIFTLHELIDIIKIRIENSFAHFLLFLCFR